MGAATIFASLVYGSQSGNDSFSDRVVRDAIMYVGTDLLRSSQVRRQERRLHAETLQELSESFDDEVEPLVVDIAGTEHRLTGTAEAQYAEWRDLLQQLFISETGFTPESLEFRTEPAEAPATGASVEESTAPAAEPAAKEISSDASGGAANGA